MQQVIPTTSFSLCNNDPWVMVWEDDFEGNSLDLSKWHVRPWGEGALYGNGGATQEYNSLDNALVSDGTLKVIAKRETVQRLACSKKPPESILEDGLPNLRWYNFTSSNLWTKFAFDNGKIEASIKIPKGIGFWPAFWTYSDYPGDEIDVFEFWTKQDEINDPSLLSRIHHMNLHVDYFSNGVKRDCGRCYTGDDFSQDFHIFTVIWDKRKIEWFVDGELKRTENRYITILGQPVCTIEAWHEYMMHIVYPRNPMSIILNLAIQSEEYAPNNSTPFPSQMEVEWVRYYQRNPCQNINITNASQFPIIPNAFNVIVGETIYVNCNFIIQSGQQLDIVAKNLTQVSGFKNQENRR